MWGFPFGRAPKNFINCNASRSVNIALAATSYQGGAVWWILQCSWMWGDGKEDKESCKCWRWHRERSKKTSRHFLDSDFYLWCDQFLEILMWNTAFLSQPHGAVILVQFTSSRKSLASSQGFLFMQSVCVSGRLDSNTGVQQCDFSGSSGWCGWLCAVLLLQRQKAQLLGVCPVYGPKDLKTYPLKLTSH